MSLQITQEILNEAMRKSSPLVIIPTVGNSTEENYFARFLQTVNRWQGDFRVEADGAFPSTGNAGSLKARFTPKVRK